MRFIATIILLTCSTIALADNTTTEKHWKGEGEFGYTLTSGNTNNETIVSKLGISYQTGAWVNAFKVESLRTESKEDTSGDTVVTANRITLSDKLSYDISERTYSYSGIRYEEDDFSGFEYQSSSTLGAGYRLLNQENISLTVEGGAGYQKDRTDDRHVQEGKVLRFSESFSYQLTSSSLLTQNLLSERGRENTYSEFNAGFKVAINGSLALKLSHLIKHNSVVPDDKENFDRVSTITLVYGF
jgi:putative salt-induced outer membrane protein